MWSLAVVAIVFFGSNFVPVKKYETGDGLFFQWVLCSGIFLVGNVVNALQGFPKFEPMAMFGGFLWATGNIVSVPVIKLIGLSLGLLIWGSTNMLIGWASGTFGLFGLKARHVATPWLNYLGLVVALISLSLYIFIKPAEPKAKEEIPELEQGLNPSLDDQIEAVTSPGDDYEKLVGDLKKGDHAAMFSGSRMVKSNSHQSLTNLADDLHRRSRLSEDIQDNVRQMVEEQQKLDYEDSFVDRLPAAQKRILGVILAAVSGLFYGSTFDPPQWVIDNKGAVGPAPACLPGSASADVKDYIFPHFTGIWITSTIYFAIYAAASKNNPYVNPQVILPGLVSGVMWAIAQSCWFLANAALGFAVSFPMITSGPGFVAAIWGVFAFTEISGRRNFIVLGCAFCTTVAAGLLIASSA